MNALMERPVRPLPESMTWSGDARLRVLPPHRWKTAVEVLADAFHDYPVMRWILGGRSNYDRDLRSLISLFVTRRVLQGELILGVEEGGALEAAGLVSFSWSSAPPAAARELSRRIWTELGTEAHSRYRLYGERVAELGVDESHMRLNMMGVRGRSQDRGLGGLLMRGLTRLSECHPEARGVALTTELDLRVPFYQHFDYEITGFDEVTAGLPAWGLFRANRGLTTES